MRTPVRKWETRVVSKRSTFELDEKSATGKDESLEDSANLAGLSSLPGFPRHTRSLGASRRKVAAAFLRAANANPDIIAAE
jgi:hypothetical protein